MKRVQRSSMLSNISRKMSHYENYIVNTIDNHVKAERREQAPVVSEPNYNPTMTWDAKSRQITKTWTF